MEHARLETARLADVDDSYYYGANCPSCLRARRISLERLRASLGGEYLLRDVRSRLKCTACGTKGLVVTFLTPAHRTGALLQFFAEAPD